MLEVKFLEESFGFLLIWLLDAIVGKILISPSYFELNSVIIEVRRVMPTVHKKFSSDTKA